MAKLFKITCELDTENGFPAMCSVQGSDLSKVYQSARENMIQWLWEDSPIPGIRKLTMTFEEVEKEE